MKNLYRIFVMVLLVVAAGCVYDYEPEDGDIQGLDSPLVVIDGDIIVGGITRVKVGLTQSLTEEEEVVPLGASVWVEGETGEVLSGRMVDDRMNEFEVDTRDLGLQGRYRLGVSIPGRGEYLSDYKSVLVSPPIDSITYSVADDRSYARIEVTTHNDSEDDFLYCKWEYIEDWESDAVYPAELDYLEKVHDVRSLDLTEINERKYCFSKAESALTYIACTEKLRENIIYKSIINEIPNTDARIRLLYAITVNQTALDKEAYIYWENVKKNSSGTGGLFSPQPSEMRGNIINVVIPGEIVLGYVNVTTSNGKRLFIDWSEEEIFSTECKRILVPKYSMVNGEPIKNQWPNYYYEGYRPIILAGDDSDAAYWALEKCTDCRVYSNSTRPDFWPR